MKSTYKELRERAWNALEGHWWEAACMVLVIGACELVIEAISGNPMENSYRSIVQILALGLLPMSYAFETSILRLVRTGESLKVNELFTVYRDNFGNSFLIKLFVVIFVLLWTCLFIVPGIVMSYAYSMSVYILNDNPDMTPMQAIKASKEMMRGHKWDLFVLDLTFIGWLLLSILTAGILLLFVQPYMNAAHAEIYREIKGEYVIIEDAKEV